MRNLRRVILSVFSRRYSPTLTQELLAWLITSALIIAPWVIVRLVFVQGSKSSMRWYQDLRMESSTLSERDLQLERLHSLLRSWPTSRSKESRVYSSPLRSALSPSSTRSSPEKGKSN